jgi:RNA polymerase sigma-70 factor (ECF subfamily)
MHDQTADDEARLLARARGGETRAFAVLVDASQQAVRGFLRRLAGSWADADDLAQEAFLIAWRRLDRFDGRASFRIWVCGIGYRLARDARRASRRSLARDTAWSETQEGPAHAAAESEARLDVRASLAGLPLDQRAAVALCLGGGFSHAEAASALNLPLGTVKSHVTRGRARLQAALSGGAEGSDA